MNTTKYSPNKSCLWFAILFLIIALSSLGFLIVLSHEIDFFTIVYIIYCVICICMSAILYKASTLVIILDDEGISLMSAKQKYYFSCCWNEINFAYSITNYKRHSYWLLSKRELTKKDAKRIAYSLRGYFLSYVNSVVVIPFGVLQDGLPIRSIIESKISNICKY